MEPQEPHSFRVELVDAPRPGPTVADQARVLQHAQVLRNCRPAYGQHPSQLIHRHGPAGELLEDGHAGSIPQGFESGL